MPWQTLVKQAWQDRVGLSVTDFYMTPDIAYDFATLQGRAFYYFCYGAAVSASAQHRARVELVAPATPERILLACERARRSAAAPVSR